MFKKTLMSGIIRGKLKHSFYGLDYNKEIKDFYCDTDKMVTPSSDPKIEKNKIRRNSKQYITYLNCKCEKCGIRKKIRIFNTLFIYKPGEYEYTDDEDEYTDDEDEYTDDEDEDEEKIKKNLKKL